MKKLLVSMLCLIGICLTFISCNNIDTFEINFIVDGNQYNIVECESEKTITFPDAPTKEGYVFEGWYLDDNIWKKPFTNELLLDTPIASDLSVYAKWGCEHISSGPATATQDEVCTVCGYVITKAVGISFKTLTVNGNDVYGKVSNDTNYYSFIDEISALGGAKYIVSTDISGTEVLPNKTMELSIGNNTVYITEYINEEPTNIYVVVIRRKPTYTVTFNSNGGNLVKPIIVAEDTIITPPQTTYVGYIFDGWNYDFSTPITSDTTIWAKWIKCEHLDAKHGETCDTCDLELKCIDVDKNNKCDNCGEKMSAKCPHEDVDEDGKCDKCGKSMSIITEVIEYPWADDDPVQLLFQMTHASNSQTLSSMCQRYLAGEDPNTIEKIDTMVADRNAMAAIKTNINVRYQYYDDADEYGLGKTIEKMLTDVKSGSTKIPDVYCNFAYDLVGASLKGTFANLKSHNYNHQGANYFEFLKDGWVQECDEDGYSVGYMYEYMQSTTLNEDKMYILASDYFVDLVRAFYVVPVHIGLLEANGAEITGDLDGDGKFNIEDFYQEVKDRKWTYNKVIEYSAKVYDDTNNDGVKNLGDTIGFAVCNGVPAAGILYTTNIEVIEWDEKDGKYIYPAESPALYNLFDAIKNLIAQTGVVYDSKKVDNIDAHLRIRKEFVENNVLFGNIIQVSSLEYTGYQQLKAAAGFGVVPVPLYHEIEEGSDENYLTSIHNVGRPGAISSATRKFAECTAFLNYQSEYRGLEDDVDSNDILIEYYKYKLQYDSDNNTDTIEMLRYIRSNVGVAFDKTFEDAIDIYFNIAHDRWHYVLSDNQWSVDVRSAYGEYATRKAGYLKTLTELFNSNELPS